MTVRSFALILCLHAGLSAAAPETLPANPQAGEEFIVTSTVCRGSSPTIFQGWNTTVDGSRIEIEALWGGSDFSVPSCAYLHGVVPGLGAGTYSVRWNDHQQPRDLGTVQVLPGEPAAPRFRALHGNWFDPAEPGWGVNIVQGGSGNLFAAWMTYESHPGLQADGASGPVNPRWFVMSRGRWISSTVFRGLLYRTVGPRPFTTDAIKVLPAGMATLSFASRDEASFEAEIFDMTPVRVGKTIRRFIF